MPEAAMWALIVSLIVYALTVSLQIVRLAFTLKLKNKEVDRCDSEIAAIENGYDNAISRVQKSNDRVVAERLYAYETEFKILGDKISQLKKPPKIKYMPYLLVRRKKKAITIA